MKRNVYVCSMYVCACVYTLEDIFNDEQVIFLFSVPPGSIPPQIGNLTLLRELILLNNDLTGSERLAEVPLFVSSFDMLIYCTQP